MHEAFAPKRVSMGVSMLTPEPVLLCVTFAQSLKFASVRLSRIGAANIRLGLIDSRTEPAVAEVCGEFLTVY